MKIFVYYKPLRVSLQHINKQLFHFKIQYDMTAQQFISIAKSSNPFFNTCYGLTRLFVETRKSGEFQMWIEYVNEYDCTTQERIRINQFNELCN